MFQPVKLDRDEDGDYVITLGDDDPVVVFKEETKYAGLILAIVCIAASLIENIEEDTHYGN